MHQRLAHSYVDRTMHIGAFLNRCEACGAVAEIPVGNLGRTESHGRNTIPGQSYPAPEAEHEVVCNDVMRFLETLEKLQRHLGIAEKVPKVGGRELHLHTLYCQVTSLGGCEQVIARKQWRVCPSL